MEGTRRFLVIFLSEEAEKIPCKVWNMPETPVSERAAQSRRAEHALDLYGNAVLRLAYTYVHNYDDAQDILQDTLVQLLRTKPVFESPEHEKAWLLRVAANLAKNRIVYNKRRAADELRDDLAAEHREDLGYVWDAVKALPENFRAAIHLHYYEGYSTAEIAKILGRKESTVRTDLRRGRMRLKRILEEEFHS